MYFRSAFSAGSFVVQKVRDGDCRFVFFGRLQLNSKIVVEEVTLATNASFAAGDRILYQVPSKTGYIVINIKPLVSGSWSDKYALIIPYSFYDQFGILNNDTSSYTWTVKALVTYFKES